MTKDGLISMLKRKIENGSQRSVAASMSVSAQYLNDVLKGKREPGVGILAGLGLERVVTYRAVAK